MRDLWTSGGLWWAPPAELPALLSRRRRSRRADGLAARRAPLPLRRLGPARGRVARVPAGRRAARRPARERRHRGVGGWRTTGGWHCEAAPPASSTPVRRLAWGEPTPAHPWGRLFSCGLHGLVTEWDLGRLSPAASYDSHGGAAWALALHGGTSTLAVGCEDGGTTLYDTRGGGEGAALRLRARLPSQGSRVLSLALDPAGAHAACGAADGSVAVWVLAARTLVSRIELEGQARKPPLVWSVLLFADLSVVTGDSAGSVRFWDGRHGTLLSSVQSHQSDILALAGTHRAILAQFCAVLRNSGAIILRPVLLYSHRRRPLRARRRSRPQSLTLRAEARGRPPRRRRPRRPRPRPSRQVDPRVVAPARTPTTRALAVRTGGGGGGGGSVVVSAGIDTQASPPPTPPLPTPRSPRPGIPHPRSRIPHPRSRVALTNPDPNSSACSRSPTSRALPLSSSCPSAAARAARAPSRARRAFSSAATPTPSSSGAFPPPPPPPSSPPPPTPTPTAPPVPPSARAGGGGGARAASDAAAAQAEADAAPPLRRVPLADWPLSRVR